MKSKKGDVLINIGLQRETKRRKKNAAEIIFRLIYGVSKLLIIKICLLTTIDALFYTTVTMTSLSYRYIEKLVRYKVWNGVS